MRHAMTAPTSVAGISISPCGARAATSVESGRWMAAQIAVIFR